MSAQPGDPAIERLLDELNAGALLTAADIA